MRIGQFIAERGESLSFEFFPPKDEPGEEQLFKVVAKLEPLNPTFVSVTYGAGGGTLKNTRHIVLRIRFWRDMLGMRLVAGLGQSGYRH